MNKVIYVCLCLIVIPSLYANVRNCNGEECYCDKKHASISYEEPCTYKRKKQWIVFVLEVVGFGVGHFYAEKYAYAIPKLVVWIFGWSMFIMMKVYSRKRGRNEEKAILVSMISCVLTLVMIIWYIVDLIIFGLNKYDDGNGVHFYSWTSKDK